jgi:tetratricopeptide (TPR) repeat protein
MRSPRAACAGAVLLLTLLGPLAASAGAQTTTPRILVMPFETNRDARIWWLGEGASVLLADRLRDRGVEAIGRDERLRAFTRLQVPPVASLSHATVIRIGQLLGATGIVVGEIAVAGNAVTVHARHIRLDTGRLLDEIVERGSIADLFATFDRLAGRVWPAATGVVKVADTTVTPAAFELYIKGLLADTPDKQVAQLSKAIAAAPSYDRPRVALWRSYSDQGQHEKALAAVTAVAAASPLSAQARLSAGLSELALKRFDDAFNRLRALADETGRAEALNDVGVVQLQRATPPAPQAGRATYWFTKATQSNPADEDYFFNLGYAYWLDQETATSIYWLREAVRRNPTDGDAHYVLGWALQASGSATESERELELARRLSERWETIDRKAGVPKGLGRLKVQLEPSGGRSETTLVATEQRDQRELAAFHLDRGRRFFEKENDREAIDELQRALYLSPYLAEAHLLLGRVYLRDGRTNDAIDALKIAVWSEDRVETHLALGEAYLQAHDADAARTEGERALALEPGSGQARSFLQRVGKPE